VFLTPGQPPMRGRDAFATGLRSVLASHRIESSGGIQEIVVSGDLAYLWAQLSVTITPLDGGPPLHRSGPTLTVFRKSGDGAWRLVRDANMLTADS
jgi:uncharacterized protein (TIGR02246 family)